MAEIDERIAGVYEPYHMSIARELERIREEWGVALLLDLHSMPPLPKPDPEERAVDFVIGDRFTRSCASDLSAIALDTLGRLGRRVEHNRPYSGGYILDRFGRPAKDIHAMQVEICRSTYLDAKLDLPGPRLSGVALVLTTMIGEIGRALVSGHGGLAEASE